jgi:hypothetical protein
MKRKIVMALVVSTFALLSGCGGGSLVGKWRLTGIDPKQKIVNDAVREFKSDGTEILSPSDVVKGTTGQPVRRIIPHVTMKLEYAVDDDKLSETALDTGSSKGKKSSSTFKIEGDKLTLEHLTTEAYATVSKTQVYMRMNSE